MFSLNLKLPLLLVFILCKCLIQINPSFGFKIDCLEIRESDSKEIKCAIELNQNDNAKNVSSVSCPRRGTLRILGNYDELILNCSSPFPLEFDYDGVQPNEAIKLTFSKRIFTNFSRDPHLYNLEIKVRSNDYLYKLAKKEGFHSARNKILYSRTGRYTVRSLNRTASQTIYIFLEENNLKPSLIRNVHTVNAHQLNDGSYMIPCRPSHMNFNVTVKEYNSQQQSLEAEFHPEIGLLVRQEALRRNTSLFECQITGHNHTLIVGADTKINFGFDKLNLSKSGSEVNMDSEVHVDSHGNFTVNLACTMRSESPGFLSVMESDNPSHSRIVQEFVLPEYINMSYWAKHGIPTSPPGLYTVKGATLSGLAFCSNEEEFRVQEYATGFDRLVRRFALGTDWSAFDISKSPPRNHLQIKVTGVAINNGTVSLYEEQTYDFSCRVRTHGLSAPVIWYKREGTERDFEQSKVEQNYDKLRNGVSFFQIKATNNLTEVACAASFWDRDFWKNVSLIVIARRGYLPYFVNASSINTIRLDKSSLHQAVKCEAMGEPIPEVWWINSAGKMLGKPSLGIANLDMSTTSTFVGNYTCFARNIYGDASTIFMIEEAEGVGYGVIIGIPLTIILTLTAIFIAIIYTYIKRIKRVTDALSAKEIQEFHEGLLASESAGEAQHPEIDNEYLPHDALVLPYNRGYEISKDEFQIAQSEVLGSGAFGIVYKGIVNGEPVAAKTVKPHAEKSYLKSLLSEIKIMIYLGKHQYLIDMIGANTKDLRRGSVWIFVEWCPLGNLEKYLRRNRKDFVIEPRYSNIPGSTKVDKCNLKDLYQWSCQIAEGMAYLQSKKVIHGDLATRNILLRKDKVAKITDFGLSRQLYNYQSYVKKNEEPLPWRWMSIESLRDLSFSSKSDVWSFGVTIWEIFTLAEVPYPGLSWDVNFVRELEKGMRMGSPKYATTELYRGVMLRCWDTEPSERPDFPALLEILETLCRKRSANPIPEEDSESSESEL